MPKSHHPYATTKVAQIIIQIPKLKNTVSICLFVLIRLINKLVALSNKRMLTDWNPWTFQCKASGFRHPPRNRQHVHQITQ